jgi:hypothetical protein
MPTLGPVSRGELIRCLRELGFDGPFAGSRHQVMLRGEVEVPVPYPNSGDISGSLLVRILREAGVSRDEWEALRLIGPPKREQALATFLT